MRPILTLLGVCAAASVVHADDGGSLGQKDPGLINLKGTIYFLEEGTDHMPEDLAKRKPQGVIYTDRLDVSPRSFTEGFPGVTDRFEWFGVLYTGTFTLPAATKLHFRSVSDDGIIVWIDGKKIIADDSIHAPHSDEGDADLTKGAHAMKVWWFQGPATEIALQLFVTLPGKEEKIFVLGDFSSDLTQAIKDVGAEATPDGIRVKLDAAVLFDTAKYALKPEAQKTLAAVTKLINAYPQATVTVTGHTDSVGDDASNQKLSENRANSVKNALVKAGTPKDVKLETHGYGKTQPVATNDTAEGRQLNRRVEILIKP